MIQRRHSSREVEWRFLYRAGSECQSEVFGMRGDRRQQHHGVIAGNLKAFAGEVLPGPAVIAVDADQIGEEQIVEAALLHGLRNVDPEVKFVEPMLFCRRRPPQTVNDVRRRVHHER